MSDFAICRTKKLKSSLEVTRAIKHNYRLTPCFRDVNDTKPGWLHGTPEGWKTARERLKGITVRKNATYCIEVVLSLSPSYFRDEPEDSGTYDFQKTEVFELQCVQWLAEFFGEENVFSSVIHYSEKTPHIHALVLPIDPKGKLNASHWLDGRLKMTAMQDSFALKMAPLGVVRGERVKPGERAKKHVTLKEFYEKFLRLSQCSIEKFLGSRFLKDQRFVP